MPFERCVSDTRDLPFVSVHALKIRRRTNRVARVSLEQLENDMDCPSEACKNGQHSVSKICPHLKLFQFLSFLQSDSGIVITDVTRCR